jgi:hypothetical protein
MSIKIDLFHFTFAVGKVIVVRYRAREYLGENLGNLGVRKVSYFSNLVRQNTLLVN